MAERDILKLLTELNSKIDVLIKVIGFFGIESSEGRSTTQKARILKMAGLDNHTIAEILHTSPATIRAVTSNLHSRRR